MILALLHGFLGQPEDWDPLLPLLPPDLRVWRPALFAPGTALGPDAGGFASWRARFLEALEARRGGEPVVVAGYSLGGRLALQAWPGAPTWARLALLAAHPGGLDAPTAKARRAWDAGWALRFREDADWPALLRDWQALPVFAASKAAPRDEAAFDRELLARAFESWSVAAQPSSWEALAAGAAGVCALAGSEDERYAALAREMGTLGVEAHIIPGAGHRLLADAPAAVAAILRDVLARAQG